ncbi:MAG: hypothetical protein QOH39_2577 [Verrucomicrobiota bacterium]|jgi:hypothetical protein
MNSPDTGLKRLFRSRSRLILPAAALLFVAVFGSHAFAAIDTYGYTAATITTDYNFEDLSIQTSGATSILDTTQDEAVTVPIGFSFTFYGVTYTSVSVSTNGLITFGGADTSPLPVNVSLNPTLANLPTVAPFWHDWTFAYRYSDSGYYVTLGTAGSRRLIIHWAYTQSYTGPGNDTVNFELKLYEGSNNIEFYYDDATLSDDVTNSNGRNAAVGIRDVNGQLNGRNLLWSFNQPVINDDSAIRITAPTFKINSVTRLANGHIVLQCTGAASLTNHIQAATNPSNASFTTLNPGIIADSTGHFTYEDTAPGTRKFYRIAYP